MYRVFQTLEEYNHYTTSGSNLTAGDIYLVKDNKMLFFSTNNFEGGEPETYDYLDEIPEGYILPSGNKSITANGENIDIAQFATATVNVAGSGGNEDLIDLIERDISTFNIPSGVTTIGGSAFQTCDRLSSVTIPNTVTSIGDYAFRNCSSLTSVTIPNSVTSIGNYAFYNCSGLTSVTIGSGVTSIGNGAFTACRGITSITIPNGVTSIGDSVFYNCSSLSSVTVEDTTPPTLGSGAFNGNASGRKIYVPSESVEAYKAASVWSNYASDIEAIPT